MEFKFRTTKPSYESAGSAGGLPQNGHIYRSLKNIPSERKEFPQAVFLEAAVPPAGCGTPAVCGNVPQTAGAACGITAG